MVGYNRARCSLESSVPKEFRVMLIVRLSASNAKIRSITSDVGALRDAQKALKSSRYALYNVLRMISMLRSSRSAADNASRK